MTSPTSDLLRGLRGRAMPRPKARWIVPGVVALVLLITIPSAPLGGPPNDRGQGSGPALSGQAHGAVAAVCGGAPSCPAIPGLSREAGAADPASYHLNHTLAWSQVATPPVGFGAGGGMVANSSSGVAVGFGGVSSGVLVNSTFAYTEATNRWARLPTSVAPTPRSDFAFALDPTTGIAVLFGGLTNLTTLSVSNQTWVYHVGSALWTLSTLGPVPAPREAAAFAIDPALGIGFLYGGWNRNYSTTGSLTYSDLWELNLSSNAWSQLIVPGPKPPPLEGAAMVWDPQASVIEMMGGCYPCSSAVWQLNPATLRWAELATPPVAPAARAAESWAYDPTVDGDLLFGGTNGVTTFNDTYLFYPLNDTWVAQTLPSGPSARSNAASAFLDVPKNETWLLAGGQSGAVPYTDLWRLSATSNLTLQVVNASDPTSPLAGALVNVSGRRAGSTDATGYLNLTQVDVVGPALQVTDDPWFYSANRTLWLPPGRPTALTVALSPEPLGTVHLLVNSSTGGPVSGVFANLTVDSVRINPHPVVTNASGNATFAGVPPGRVNLTTKAWPWRSAYVTGVLPPGGVLNTTMEMYYDPVVFLTLFGRLPGGISLLPMAFAPVYLNGSLLGFTQSDGTLTSTTSAFGLVPITGTAPGFFSSTQYLAVPFTGSVSITLVLQSLPLGVLVVAVVRASDSLPLGGATVTATTTIALAFGSYAQTNFTDDEGISALSLPEGQYLVTASAPGYLSSSGVITNVTSGPNVPLTIRLTIIPPANVSLLVRDRSSGAPIPGANVTFVGILKGESNEWGYYNETNITPGTYVCEVSAPRYLENVTTFYLASAENLSTTVNLTLLPLVSVVGTGWGFNLFPGGLSELWPFLLAPFLLVLGAFVFASVLRGERDEDGTAAGAVDSPRKKGDAVPDRPTEAPSGTPPS